MQSKSRIISLFLITISVLVLISSLVSTNAQANEVSVDIVPVSGAVGTIFEITISQAEPNEEYTIDFIYDSSGDNIFSTTATSDDDGMFVLTISTSESDLPGLYRVQTHQGGAILGEGEFTIEGELPPTPETSEPSDNNAAPASGTISIEPDSDVIGSLHTISVGDLAANSSYEVQIVVAETGETVYSRDWDSDGDGNLEIEIFTEEEDALGEYVVSVIDANGENVAQASFIVEPMPERNTTLTVTPQTIANQAQYEIYITGLVPFEEISLQIIDSDNAEVYSSTNRANDQGEVTVVYLPEDALIAGDYELQVFADRENIATTILQVENEGTVVQQPNGDDEPIFTIEPSSGEIGTNYTLDIHGLEPESAFTLEIRQDASGDTVYSTDREADADGNFNFVIASEDGDTPGNYTVVIIQDGDVITEATMTIEGDGGETDTEPNNQTDTTPAGDYTISIEPPSGDRGTRHTITVTGLEPDATVRFILRLNDESVFETERIASEEGIAILDVTSEDGDAAGTYDVQVLLADEEIASASFDITGENITQEQGSSDDTEGDTEAATSEFALDLDSAVAVTITPAEGARGTSHNIQITGLAANEAVMVEIVWGILDVYTSERTADANGEISYNIVTEKEDAPGGYMVNIIRNQSIIAQGDLRISRSEDTVVTAGSSGQNLVKIDRKVDVSILPPSGAIGTSHNIQVTGLGANEVVQIDMAFGDDKPYSTERTADANGNISFRVVTEEGDTPGMYQLNVIRDGIIIDNEAVLMIQDEAGNVPEFVLTEVDGTITYGESASTSFNATTSIRTYTFDGNAGEQLDILVDSANAIDTAITIVAPNRQAIASDDDSGSGFDPEITGLILDQSGTYTLILEAYTPGESGTANIEIISRESRTLSEGSQVIRLNDKQSVDAVVFQAEQGDEVSLQVTVLSGNANDLLITAFQNGVSVMSFSTSGLGNGATLGFVAPEDGVIAIRVENIGGTQVEFEISIER